MTDEYVSALPKEEQGRIEMQKILMLKSKEMEKIKREFNDQKGKEKYNDDYEVPDNMY